MAIVDVKEILKHADENKYAVPAFDAYNYESIKWVIEIAEELQSPVILMLYPSWISWMSMESFVTITKQLASKVKVPIGLHLDHSNTAELAIQGIQSGFQSVMIDGSAFDYETNVEMTKQVVMAAHEKGVDVEAELGHVGEAFKERDFSDKDTYTCPEQIKDFVLKTGVDSIAVAIGNAHGPYVKEPKLDLKRLQEINDAIDIPIVLHGGSGIPSLQIQEAVKRGINKVNIASEYVQAITLGMKDALNEDQLQGGILGATNMAEVKAKKLLREKFELVNPDRKGF